MNSISKACASATEALRGVIVTELAVFARPDRKSTFKLLEVAPGVTVDEVKAKTAAAFSDQHRFTYAK